MLVAMPNVPPRLETLFRKYDPQLYFVTFTHHRKALLARPNVHSGFVAFAQRAHEKGISVGRYVLMPDHVHLFASNGAALTLSEWIRLLKRALSKELPSASPPHWQRGFFDHLIRQRESYAAKWLYIRNNPVRAGLVQDPEAWPYQGEIIPLESL
jgi:putative transposase